MGKYFTIKELCASQTATNFNIDNTPSGEVVNNLNYLIDNLLDKIRERYGAPIYVTSGYRSSRLNVKVGGVATSQHLNGEAADITTRMIGSNKVLFDLIRTMVEEGEIEFDQLIDEKNYSWIHISLKKSNNRNQILHLK